MKITYIGRDYINKVFDRTVYYSVNNYNSIEEQAARIVLILVVQT